MIQGAVLIVDDTLTNLEVLFDCLATSGFRILVAEDGESALQKARYALPDLILLDILMPNIDGFETCRRLKAEPSTAEIPVIFMSALTDTVDKVAGFNLGAVDYITKPFQQEEVLARVTTHLRLRHLTQQLQVQNQQLEAEIQERQRTEAERDRFFTLSLDLLCIGDFEGNLKRFNPAFESALGYTHEELQRQPLLDLVHPEDLPKTLAEIANLRQGLPGLDFENRYRAKDGSYRWFSWRATALPEVGLIYAIARDVTQQKQVEIERLQLLAQEQQARAAAEAAHNRINNILESITDAFFALDQQWRFTYLNSQAEFLLQRSKTDLLGQSIWDEFPETVASQFHKNYHLAVAKQVNVEFEEFYPPLQTWFAVHAYPAQEGLSVYFQDITSRKHTEINLQRQYQRSQLFAEVTLKIRQSLNLTEILQTAVTEVQKILQADRVLVYRLWSDGYGSSIAEAVLPGLPMILGRKFPEEVFPPEYRELYRQGRVRHISDINHEDEKVAPCLKEFVQQFQVQAKLVVPILIQDNLWGLLIAHQCQQTRHWSQFEIDLLQQLADQMGIALTQAQLLEQETRQRQELVRSNSELQQFAYIASHDLQEPLRMITSYLQLLERRYQDQLDDAAHEFIGYAIDGAIRMKTLINDLLAYSRVGTRGKPFVRVECTAVLQQAIANLQFSIAEAQATVTWEPLPELMADASQLTQLFQNLISNAIKFRGQEPPAIHISATHQDDHWQFRVRDNGIGIEPQYSDRIFVIFQRLHNRTEYPGTGIGLAICKKIVERHEGNIWIESEPGKGTTFYFTLADSAQ